MKLRSAVAAVERAGIILVFPIQNRPDPPSLWSAMFPGAPMRWDWDASADDRVVDLWHLREALARSGKVAYAKWFRGRATFFSLPVFHAILGRLAARGDVFAGLPREAVDVLDLLREDSPRSSKAVREAAGLRGRPFEALFQHAMKALWTRLLTVGVGEIDDGAFPSLAVAATETMFEDLWTTRRAVPTRSQDRLAAALARVPRFARELERAEAAVVASRGDEER